MPSAEVQAKHGMTGGAKLDEFLGRLTGSSQGRVVLAVNRSSSKKLYTALSRDLDRIRSGRTDGLAAETEEIRKKLGTKANALERLFVVPVDVDDARDPEWKGMAVLLSHALVDPEKVTAAQAVLADDGNRLCAKRLRRTRKELVDLLASAQISVKPPAKEERWHRELDFSLRLLKEVQNETALSILEGLERKFRTEQVEANVRYRLLQQKAAALLRLNRLQESLAHAQRAVDLDSTRPEALRISALASLMLGDTPAAVATAERAIAAGPHDPQAWAVAAQVAAASGREHPQPPADVAASTRYRQQLADIAATEGDWAAVVRVTAEILSTGSREPETLFLRGMALANLAVTDASGRPERAAEAERVADEMLDVLRQDHPLAIQALGIRSAARRLLGRVDEANADAALAVDRAGDNPEALRRRAAFLSEGGDLRAALAVLRHPVVQSDLGALSLRARLLAQIGETDDAVADLTRVLERLPSEPPSEPLCFSAVDAAVMLRSAELAEAAFACAPKRVTDAAYRNLIRGRIAFLKGDFDRGVEILKGLADEDGARRTDLLIELALRQQRAGRHQDAVCTFERVGVQALPREVLANYAAALIAAEAFVGAKVLLDRATAELSPLPDWAVRLGAHLALIQEDPNAAIATLTELVTRAGEVDAAVRVNLAAAFIEVDRQAEANAQLDLLVAATNLTAEESVRTTLLLRAVGRTRAAIDVAYRALKRSPQDPHIHRVLVGVAMSSISDFAAPAEVSVGVSVRVQDQKGASKWWTVVAPGEPADPLRGEMSVADARALGLMGQKVGGVLTRNPGAWNQEEQTIAEIVPAELHAVQDAMTNFADRFPREPFFATSFSVGDLSSVRDLAPFIGSVEARRKHAKLVLRLYEQQVFPLGFVAQALGAPISDVMITLSAGEAGHQPALVAEWPDRAGQVESIAAANGAQTVVLTRSSLQTAHELELLALLPQVFSTIVPRTLIRELRLELKNAEDEVARGKTTLGSGTTGLVMQEVPPDHPVLRQIATSIRDQLEWVTKNARIEARPLESMQNGGGATEQLRTLIGFSSADSVDLVRHRPVTLYADDLGLRRLFQKGEKRSFSTVGLLALLLSRDLVDEAKYTRLLLQLVARRHVFISPSRRLLMGAVREYGEFAQAKVAQAFALLGAPGGTLAESARVVAEVVRTTALATIQLASIDRIVDLSLGAMVRAWPPTLCARVVTAAVSDVCLLMPEVVRQVERASAQWLRRALVEALPQSGGWPRQTH